jgi:crotonobetaine/carnitine-CoA ligase
MDPGTLAPNAVARWAREAPDQVFLEHVDGRALTYAEVDARMDRCAAGLAAAGLGPGAHVATFLSDPLDGALLWLGVARAGMVSIPVNTAHLGRMLEHVLRISQAEAVVVSADLAPRLDEVADALPDLRAVLGPDLDAEPTGERHVVAPHETAMLLFTSGSTGPSKAVVVPWAAARGYWGWVPEDMLRPGEGLFLPMPMFHNAGLGALQQVAWRGGRLCHQGRFSATTFWDDVRRSGAVAAGLVGPMTGVLWSQPPRDDDADNPLRGMILGPMIPEMDAFERRFGVRVATCYGMTEVPAVLVTGWDHGPTATCGRRIEGWPDAEVRIVDEHDHKVPVGEVGELVVRTGAPWTLNGGYFGDDAATARSWRNGWFHTGDAFRCDEDGWFTFVDRMTDTIRRRGENISSFEVEAFVFEHPGVGACAAYGVPDGFGGDEVMVAVEGEVDPAELGAFLAERMPKYMAPRYIEVVDELPRNATTLRLQKFVLRDRGVTASTWDRERL